MRYIDTLLRAVTVLFRVLLGLCFLVLIVAVLVQVLGRFGGSSPVWTEELTRFALLYLAAVGAGLALRTGDLVNVDVVIELLPERAAWACRLLSAVLIAALGLGLLPGAWRFVSIGSFQTAPALGIPMTYAHFSVFLMLALLAFFALLRIVGMFAGTTDGRPESMPVDTGAN